MSNLVTSSQKLQAINKSRGLEDRHFNNPGTAIYSVPNFLFEQDGTQHKNSRRRTNTCTIEKNPSKFAEAEKNNVEETGPKPIGPGNH
ncbi:hypothetical protein N7501_001981 [Penicillium viridicatum]|nr:hypothetical protein N7501_001981 [Penicillium viridicatum]